MVDSDASLMSPLSDKVNFDWFDFKSDKPSQTTTHELDSPVSATSSPRIYFSPNSHENKSFFFKSSSRLFTESQSLPVSKPPHAFQVVYPPLPNKPLAWVWQCHICRSRYPLSVTRRCLIDGHYYCSGESSNQRNIKRRRKAQSCTSEFDYVGWQDWGQWMRKCMALQSLENAATKTPTLQGCHGCSFPSQCRYESRPRIETIELRKYIKKNDLLWEHFDEASNENDRDTAASETSANSLLRTTLAPSSNLALSASNGAPRLNKLKKDRKPSTSATDVQLDVESLNGNPTPTRRQRFYSSFSGSNKLRSPESSPTSPEPSPRSPSSSANIATDRGRFDPTLPSLVFAAAETQPKKQRTNSKPDDPEFAIPSSSATTATDLSSLSSPSYNGGGPLTRTTSRQNLPSFLLRTLSDVSPPSASVTRTPDMDDSHGGGGILSSADITSSLLRLDTRNDESGAKIAHGPDFEDILLSPSPPHGERGTGSSGSSAGVPWKISGVEQPTSTAEKMSFLFPSFGFGGRR